MTGRIFSIFLLMLILIFFGCEKSVDNTSTGILSVKLTDTPFPIDMVSEANVTINKIEVRKAQAGSEGSPYLILSEDEFSYNLLDLRNGLTADLVKIEVPAGDYDLVRLYVASADIKLKDETVYNLKVPSGDATGIKIFIDPSIRVVGGLTTDLVLDFDVSQSFVVQGNPYTAAGINGFIFKPVIRAADMSISGSLKGRVIDSEGNALENANVWIEDNGMMYSTFSDAEGLYILANLPEGTYTLNATKVADGVQYDTVMVENVEVVAGNVIQLEDIILTQQ